MTLVEMAFVYGRRPGERVTRALRQVREVYGIWRVSMDESNSTIRVEYDASRLREDDVAALLRNAGLDLLDNAKARLAATAS